MECSTALKVRIPPQIIMKGKIEYSSHQRGEGVSMNNVPEILIYVLSPTFGKHASTVSINSEKVLKSLMPIKLVESSVRPKTGVSWFDSKKLSGSIVWDVSRGWIETWLNETLGRWLEGGRRGGRSGLYCNVFFLRPPGTKVSILDNNGWIKIVFGGRSKWYWRWPKI